MDSLAITDIHMVATGETSEAFLEGSGDSITLAGMTAKLVPLDLPLLSGIRADRYSGEIRIRTEGVEDTSSTSFELSVRNGPWWVIFSLLVGLLIGRIVVLINQSGGKGTPSSRRSLMQFQWASGFRWNGGEPGVLARIGSTITGVAWTLVDTKKGQFRVRAGISATLLAIVIYEGLKALYLNDLTFGDNGLLDYVAVFAWALATDAGQRFVTNLGWDPG